MVQGHLQCKINQLLKHLESIYQAKLLRNTFIRQTEKSDPSVRQMLAAGKQKLPTKLHYLGAVKIARSTKPHKM
jgi:hypothetical protein